MVITSHCQAGPLIVLLVPRLRSSPKAPPAHYCQGERAFLCPSWPWAQGNCSIHAVCNSCLKMAPYCWIKQYERGWPFIIWSYYTILCQLPQNNKWLNYDNTWLASLTPLDDDDSLERRERKTKSGLNCMLCSKNTLLFQSLAHQTMAL